MTPRAERVLNGLLVGLVAVLVALLANYVLTGASLALRAVGSAFGGGVGAWIALQLLARG